MNAIAILKEYESINKLNLSPAALSKQYSSMVATREFLDLPIRARLVCGATYFALILNAIERKIS